MSMCLFKDFRAVIFDMDGVITNTMPYHFDAWQKIFLKAGIKVNCYDIYKREGQDGASSVQEISREYKFPLTKAQAQEILLQKERLFKRIVKIRFVPGAKAFLRMVKTRGYLLGLVTGTSRHEMEKILPLGLRKLFDAIVTGNDVTKGKPHPDPFLKALRLLKIKPREGLVIENAPFGISAAKKAKLCCVALETSLPRKYLREADVICKTFAQLERAMFLKKSIQLKKS